MTAAMAGNTRWPDGRPWDELLRAWRELDVPEGWRAEIDGGRIQVVPPPHAHHNGIAAKSTLFSSPDRGAHQNAKRVPFGDPVELPAPFGVKVDSSVFPV